MALFPSEAVALNFTGLTEVREWVGLSDEAWTAFQEQTGDMSDNTRNMAMLQPDIVLLCIRNARTPAGSPMNPVACAQVGLIWRIARRTAFVAGGGNWNEFVDLDPLGPEPPIQPQTANPPSGSGPAPP